MGVILALLFLSGSLFAQEQPSTNESPLPRLKNEVKRVLAEAQLPFTPDQENAIETAFFLP